MRFVFWVSLLLSVQELQAQVLFDSLYTIRRDTLFFAFGEHALSPRSDSVLLDFARKARTIPRCRIRITAHTDSIGSSAANEVLSQQRAAAVAGALKALAIADSSITTSIYGERRPIRENASAEGRQLNRRATLALQVQRKFVRLRGRLADPDTGDGIRGYIRYLGDSIPTDSSGAFALAAPLGTTLPLEAYAPKRFYYSQALDLTRSQPGEDLRINLERIQAGKVFPISNLFFVSSKAVLLPRSVPELPKILRFLEANPRIRVEIAGHMNAPFQAPVPKGSWEYDLSLRRARLIYDYLIDHGISPFRLQYNGYGNWEMRYPRATTAPEFAQNRRVELRVLD